MILACQNIHKAFGEKVILKDASFHIEEREKAAIVGINGAGKSTLLKIIMGELAADDGQVIITKGKTIGCLAQHQEMESNGTIFQELVTVKQDVLDLEAVSAVAHENGIPLIVDSTFATPFLLRPLEHGADIVVHSATKFMGGHGSVMGGVIVDGGKFDWTQNDKFPGITKPNPSYHGVVFSEACGNIAYVMKIRTTLMRDQGATISPFNSFLLLQGLETLSLRVERHVENALKVVEFLKNHPQVEKVNHPSLAEGHQLDLYNKYFPNGAASIFTFEVKGGQEKAQKFTESLELFSLLANVADVKSLVIHPASTTHSQMNEEELREGGITPSTVRLSIGTENIDDIIADLEHGFEAIK